MNYTVDSSSFHMCMRRGGFFVGYGNLKGNIEKRGVLNGYEVGSNRPRMMESNSYFGE